MKPGEQRGMRSSLARVRGLGSAKEGVVHWWAQRVTAIALVPLSVWLAGNFVALAGAKHEAVVAWIASPVGTVLMLLSIAAIFHHAQLGLQVVIEDYVHGEGLKLAALLAVKGLAILLGTIAGLAVLSISLGA